jgi:hypothetical protein
VGINLPRDTCLSSPVATPLHPGVQPSSKSSMWTSKGSGDIGATLSPVARG